MRYPKSFLHCNIGQPGLVSVRRPVFFAEIEECLILLANIGRIMISSPGPVLSCIGMVKILIMGSRNVYSIFIPIFGCRVSGVSVQRRRWPEKRPV